MGILGAIAGSLSSLGASSLVMHACTEFIPANIGKIRKGLYVVGAIGLSGAAGTAAGNYVGSSLDSLVEGIKAIKTINAAVKEGVAKDIVDTAKEINEEAADESASS